MARRHADRTYVDGQAPSPPPPPDLRSADLATLAQWRMCAIQIDRQVRRLYSYSGSIDKTVEKERTEAGLPVRETFEMVKQRAAEVTEWIPRHEDDPLGQWSVDGFIRCCKYCASHCDHPDFCWFRLHGTHVYIGYKCFRTLVDVGTVPEIWQPTEIRRRRGAWGCALLLYSFID